MNRTPAISLVLTAHNEAAHIGRTLREIAAQSGDFEVILVDDRSTDPTRDQAQAAGIPGLRILASTPDSTSALTTRQQALDLGFRAARGAVIVTLDADSQLQPGWIEAMTRPILEGRVAMVAGPIAFAGRGWIAGWQNCDAAYYLLVSAILSRLGLRSGAMFGNFAFRAALYPQLGGFATLKPSLTEDLAFFRALQAAGHRHAFLGSRARVTVQACGGFHQLVRRTLRITRAPVSGLAVVLTLWPLTLLLAALWAMLPAGGAEVLVWRYGAGVLVTGAGILRNSAPRQLVFAPIYEPIVFVIAAAAVVSRLRNPAIHWGGRRYD